VQVITLHAVFVRSLTETAEAEIDSYFCLDNQLGASTQLHKNYSSEKMIVIDLSSSSVEHEKYPHLFCSFE